MYDPASAIKGKDAVFEAHPENPAVKALADLATDAKFDRDELTITVARESIVAAAEALQAGRLQLPRRRHCGRLVSLGAAISDQLFASFPSR